MVRNVTPAIPPSGYSSAIPPQPIQPCVDEPSACLPCGGRYRRKTRKEEVDDDDDYDDDARGVVLNYPYSGRGSFHGWVIE